MRTVSLVGKNYDDTILYAHGVVEGETNEVSDIVVTHGGMYNLLEARMPGIDFDFHPCGAKEVWVVSDSSSSRRTSFVKTSKASIVDKDTIDEINARSSWAHVCYIDDIEFPDNLLNLRIPFSLDFCTIKNREGFFTFMKRAAAIFDSRERKHLYHNIDIEAPIILHDESGVEVIVNREVIYTVSNRALNGLNVNGAGDIFAAHFIKNYFQLNLNESSYHAMLETTKTLVKRSNEEI